MIDITQPDMILMRDGVTVSRHRSPVEAMERAAKEGPGVYTLVRPDATITVSGEVVEPNPDPEPEPEPEPDPEPQPEPGRKPQGVVTELDRSNYISFAGHYGGGSAYRREQYLVVLKQGQTTLPFYLLNGATRQTIPAGTEMTLLADGEPVTTLILDAATDKPAFDVPISALDNGWHVFTVKGYSTAAFPAFVLHDSPESNFMPVMTTSYEAAHWSGGKKTYPTHDVRWVPANFNPTPKPLAPRTFTPFSHSNRLPPIVAEQLVIGTASDVRRPVVDEHGIWSTFNLQRYHYHNFHLAQPLYPLLDGPRGVGSVHGVTHLQIGTGQVEDKPDSPLMGNVYGLDTWRMFRVSADGTVTTLIGYRSKPPGNYWGDEQELELVGDWSAIPEERRGLHEPWGFAWYPRTLAVDNSAAPIPSEDNRKPHIMAPVCFIADTQNNRILRVEFNATAHGIPPKVTEFITGVNDPWECVEWQGKLLVSERLSHRIAQYSMETGELERVVVRGAPLSDVPNSTTRWVSRLAPLETIRAEGVVGPEGIYALGDWLYYGSQSMAQVKRVHLVAGEIEHVCDVPQSFATGNKFVKITVSDGSFGPEGTVFVGQWDARMPIAYLPDGTQWQYGWGHGVVYDICCAIKGGRFVYAGAGEGIYEIRLRTDEPAINSTRYNAGKAKWIERGYYYTHGELGYGYHGEALPWGEHPDIDYFLTVNGLTEQ
tara:strand:+ start:16182 stop:18314 length:2133 start_codon:yes stop_codon:yes gene_type:complete